MISFHRLWCIVQAISQVIIYFFSYVTCSRTFSNDIIHKALVEKLRLIDILFWPRHFGPQKIVSNMPQNVMMHHHPCNSTFHHISSPPEKAVIFFLSKNENRMKTEWKNKIIFQWGRFYDMGPTMVTWYFQFSSGG